MTTYKCTEDKVLTPFQSFQNAIRDLVRKSTTHRYCNINLEDGYLEIKVVEAVKNTIANGISTIAKTKTLLAVDTTTMVPVVYEGSAESIGTDKYKLAEMVDDLMSH